MMASAIIHLAVAKELYKKLKVKRRNDYYLGAIAPDISKQIGRTKEESHFLINTKQDVPNIDLFVKKYHDFRNNSFDLGYFIHLYTDKIWFEKFISNITCNNSIKLLDGTILNTTPEEMEKMIYTDYTNLNIQIIENYDMDLSLFYEEFKVPKTNIKEIPVEKLDILINKMGILIENTKQEKAYTFDIYLVENFIEEAVNEILNVLENDYK
jgi:hypothetical protein